MRVRCMLENASVHLNKFTPMSYLKYQWKFFRRNTDNANIEAEHVTQLSDVLDDTEVALPMLTLRRIKPRALLALLQVNMFAPTEVTSDIYAQIVDMVHMLKLVAMYIVRMESWVFLPCYRNNLALVWMELH